MMRGCSCPSPHQALESALLDPGKSVGRIRCVIGLCGSIESKRLSQELSRPSSQPILVFVKDPAATVQENVFDRRAPCWQNLVLALFLIRIQFAFILSCGPKELAVVNTMQRSQSDQTQEKRGARFYMVCAESQCPQRPL